METSAPHHVIAIDGPAASGKSSVARQLARQIGFAYVNSGYFYRVVTLRVLQSGFDPQSPEQVKGAVRSTEFTSGFTGHEAYFHTGDAVNEEQLRDESVNRAVSPVSQVPIVRDVVTAHLRRLGQDRNVVVEGRDIGSIVFPETPYKFYIDASPEVRQQRRSAQGQKDEIATRDRIDSSRANAPLIIAEDALVIDSTHLTVDGVVGEIIGRLKLRGLALSAS